MMSNECLFKHREKDILTILHMDDLKINAPTKADIG